MRIIAATNFDDGVLETFRAHSVDTVYAHVSDCVREGVFLRPGSPEAVHIGKLAGNKVKIIFAWGDACFNNAEFTIRGRKHILALLEGMARAGAWAVTLDSPYLVEMVKKEYPCLKVGVSQEAGVDSLQRAKFWDSMGIDFINLPAETLNRDFQMIAAMKNSLRCGLHAVANSACFNACPFLPYRRERNALSPAETEARGRNGGGDRLPYCWHDPAPHPEYILSRSCWIRPEDAGFYASLGIDAFLLLGKDFSRERLAILIKAYANGRYEGNLAFLLSGGCVDSVHPERHREDWFFIDNKALVGFIETLADSRCRERECPACGYCRSKAGEALRLHEIPVAPDV